jgi:hypothetical protein
MKLLIALVIAAVVVGFLGFTDAGHQLRSNRGLAAPCGSDSNC